MSVNNDLGGQQQRRRADAVTTVSTKRDVAGGDLDIRFPSHSFTLLEVQLA